MRVVIAMAMVGAIVLSVMGISYAGITPPPKLPLGTSTGTSK